MSNQPTITQIQWSNPIPVRIRINDVMCLGIITAIESVWSICWVGHRNVCVEFVKLVNTGNTKCCQYFSESHLKWCYRAVGTLIQIHLTYWQNCWHMIMIDYSEGERHTNHDTSFILLILSMPLHHGEAGLAMVSGLHPYLIGCCIIRTISNQFQPHRDCIINIDHLHTTLITNGYWIIFHW